MTDFSHEPVLLEEVLTALITDASEGAWYIDGTLGGGGHAAEVLGRTHARLLGIDRDREALAAAGERLAAFAPRYTLAHGNHRDMPDIARENGVGPATGILLDLGVSSHQLDVPERGFSYQHDAPLDMRMDGSSGMTAADIVNGYPAEMLAKILGEYGEERHAGRIARAIIAARPVSSTAQLAAIIDEAMPGRSKRTGGHPARRTFQALRIAVNDELDGLSQALDACLSCLVPGGRLCVITFHSLEDRIVKQRFRLWENPCECPRGAPKCVCGKQPLATLPHRHGIVPSEAEVERNPRARSARLRIAQATDAVTQQR